VLLAIATIATGFIPFGKFISPTGYVIESKFHPPLAFAAITSSLIGIGIATVLYRKQNALPERISVSLGNIYRSAYKKFYIDELYLFVTKKIIFNLISAPAAWIDKNIVDGLMNMLSVVTENFSDCIKEIQSGKIADYVFWFFAGAIGLAVMVIYIT
jgi:NADH-quinone oxidoreductase subunit L